MRVLFYANLRAAAGAKAIEVNVVPPVSVHDVLHRVTDSRPKLCRELWDEGGHLHDHIKVFVNGRELAYLPNGIRTMLKTGDEVDVFPPVGGGCR